MARISEMHRYDSSLNRIGNIRSSLDEAQEMASSGRKLRKVSDDPVATVRLLRNRTKLENVEQFRKNRDFGLGFIAKTEDALSALCELITRAKELAIQQSNATYDDSSRHAVAAEVRQHMEQIIGIGNMSYNDRYIFGGFQTKQPPISSDGSYLGDDGCIFLQLDEDTFRPINTNGRDIFELPLEQEGQRQRLFDTFKNLYTALINDDKDLMHATMDDLDYHHNAAVTLTASLGARQAAIDNISVRMDLAEVQLYKDNQNLEGVDIIKSAMDLKKIENSLQHTLQSTTKILAPSLMEFLK